MFFTPTVNSYSLVTICMILMVVSRLGVVLFPTDLEGAKHTTTGRLHYGFAIGTFAFAATAIANASEAVLALQPSPLLSSLLLSLKWSVLIAVGATTITMVRPLRRFFGVSERVFLLSMTLWFLTLSLWFVNTRST
jgi:hypothetical protein